jgi:hypothetical protein
VTAAPPPASRAAADAALAPVSPLVPVSPLTLIPLGDASAAACEGDACAIPLP